MNHAAPPLRKLRPDLPEAFEPIVKRAMEKSLGDRYQSWIEFGKDLAALVRNLDLPREGLSDTRKYNALRNLSFFRDFLEVEVWEVLRISSWERIPAEKVIIREGDRGDSFYVLVEGEVEVTRAGRELNRLVPGDCFGEMLYFADQTAVRSTTIRALKPLLVIEIKAASLSASSDACQVRFNKAFMRILIERLTAANQKLVEVKER
jgi:hypothetical protein